MIPNFIVDDVTSRANAASENIQWGDWSRYTPDYGPSTWNTNLRGSSGPGGIERGGSSEAQRMFDRGEDAYQKWLYEEWEMAGAGVLGGDAGKKAAWYQREMDNIKDFKISEDAARRQHYIDQLKSTSQSRDNQWNARNAELDQRWSDFNARQSALEQRWSDFDAERAAWQAKQLEDSTSAPTTPTSTDESIKDKWKSTSGPNYRGPDPRQDTGDDPWWFKNRKEGDTHVSRWSKGYRRGPTNWSEMKIGSDSLNL